MNDTVQPIRKYYSPNKQSANSREKNIRYFIRIVNVELLSNHEMKFLNKPQQE